MACVPELKHLSLVLTTRCNLSCTYCFQNAARPRSMKWTIVSRALDLALASQADTIDINFSGGEPLLEMDMIRRAVRHIRAHAGSGPAPRFHLLTNGLLLSPQILEFLIKEDFRIQLSCDGIASAQDHRGRGTHKQLELLLDLLRNDHADFLADRLRVAVTVIPQTIAVLDKSVAWLIAKGVPTISLAASLTPVDGWHDGRRDTLRKVFARIMTLSRDCQRQSGRIPLILYRGRSPVSPPLALKAGQALCGFQRRDALAVDVDGRVHPCSTMAESIHGPGHEELLRQLAPWQIGRLDEDGFREHETPARDESATASSCFFRKEHKYSSFQSCRECRYVHSCRVCPLAIALQPAPADPCRVPDFVCAFNEAALASRGRFLDMDDSRHP